MTKGEELFEAMIASGATFDVWSPIVGYEAAAIMQRLLEESRGDPIITEVLPGTDNLSEDQTGRG